MPTAFAHDVMDDISKNECNCNDGSKRKVHFDDRLSQDELIPRSYLCLTASLEHVFIDCTFSGRSGSRVAYPAYECSHDLEP